MKKILILCAFAVSAISCLTKGAFSQSYVADVTFDFTDKVYASSFKDSLYVLSDGSGFAYGQYPVIFTQKHLDGKFQGGFLMSCLKGEGNGKLEQEAKENDLYRVHSKSGADGTKGYVVFYNNPVESMMYPHDIEFGYKDAGAFTPYSCYVNNTTHVARMIKENFVDGDRLVLKATGHRHDGSTAVASIVLAEQTEAKDTVMYNWTKFDLSKLGPVDFIDFELNSTNPSVPAYFCMDGLLAGVQIEY
jgi:hypothetical protein